MPAPSSCPGSQPTELKLLFNSQNYALYGGGDNCEWANTAETINLYLDEEQELWTLDIASAVSGGPATETLDTTDVRGTYDNGAIVSDP